MTDVVIHSEPVELYKILKFEGLVNSGGQAKQMISDGLVMVNDEVETRKRRKIHAGDTLDFQGQRLTIVLAPA